MNLSNLSLCAGMFLSIILVCSSETLNLSNMAISESQEKMIAAVKSEVRLYSNLNEGRLLTNVTMLCSRIMIKFQLLRLMQNNEKSLSRWFRFTLIRMFDDQLLSEIQNDGWFTYFHWLTGCS